jgi:hypothetical protein
VFSSQAPNLSIDLRYGIAMISGSRITTQTNHGRKDTDVMDLPSGSPQLEFATKYLC